MLDAMDVMLYSLVLSHLMRDLGMGKGTAGALNSLTLLASALGGIVFGFVADRVGRTRALMASILVYSVASGACGLSRTIVELGICRFVLGLGMGGEWTTGAALIAETWRPEHRGKALGLMQSTWAIGEMVAIGVVAFVLPGFGWRAVFFVGVLPAVIVFWIRRRVPESTSGSGNGSRPPPARSGSSGGRPAPERHRGHRHERVRDVRLLGLFTWIPAYLSLPVEQGGRGLDLMKTNDVAPHHGIGKWLGYALFGFFADSAGRRRTYVAYLIVAAALVPLFGVARTPAWLLLLGPLVAFFGTGYFSGFGAIVSGAVPDRDTRDGDGPQLQRRRGLSAAAPTVVGLLANRFGLGSAFFLQAGAFFAAALLALALPETKGRRLD